MNLQSHPSYAALQAAGEQFEQEKQRIADLCIKVQQIAAPTGAEQARARWVEAYFQRLGLADVQQDAVYNVYGRVPGDRPAPAVLVSAHTDTVFPAETDLRVRTEAETGHIFGPGIGDNSTGVAGLLILAESLTHLPTPPVDIWLVANSGEEGLGDLKGMRAALDRLGAQVGASVVVEGMGVGRIVHRGLGVRRYRISANAPGGHSWSDFGTASAIHALALLAAELTRMKVPTEPRTTFNIGKIRGGTSINTIAQTAALDLDLRSEEPDALAALIQQVEEIVACRQEHHRQAKDDVRIQMVQIGNRPAGQVDAGHPLVTAAAQIAMDVGINARPDLRISSTDANIPLSRHIPAVCIGLTEGGNAHRLEEWIDPALLGKGVHQLLLLTWWTAAWLTEPDAQA